MTQLIDVEEIVDGYKEMISSALLPPPEWIEKVLQEANTLHTQKVEEAVREEREKTESLWDILDDIDSLPDMIHPNTAEGHEKCWKMMVKWTERRHEVLKSDGYILIPNTKI
tara:strand:+ start:168 stop:503 length:336 start_codon:yes stop_codon:yes gene_type:complete